MRELHKTSFVAFGLRHRQHLAGEHKAAARILTLHRAVGQEGPREAENEVCRKPETFLHILPGDSLRMSADVFKHGQRPVESGRLVA